MPNRRRQSAPGLAMRTGLSRVPPVRCESSGVACSRTMRRLPQAHRAHPLGHTGIVWWLFPETRDAASFPAPTAKASSRRTSVPPTDWRQYPERRIGSLTSNPAGTSPSSEGQLPSSRESFRSFGCGAVAVLLKHTRTAHEKAARRRLQVLRSKLAEASVRSEAVANAEVVAGGRLVCQDGRAVQGL